MPCDPIKGILKESGPESSTKSVRFTGENTVAYISDFDPFNITVYKRDIKHIELEDDLNFGVSPVLLMIERFLNTYVIDMDELNQTSQPYSILRTKYEQQLQKALIQNQFDQIEHLINTIKIATII